MGAWSKDSKTRVATMSGGDFYGSEVATTIAAPTTARIELVGSDGTTTVLKPKIPLKAGEIIDCSVMNAKKLNAFYASAIEAAKKEGILFSCTSDDRDDLRSHLSAIAFPCSSPKCRKHGEGSRARIDPTTASATSDRIETLRRREGRHQGPTSRPVSESGPYCHGHFRKGITTFTADD